jgi:hypothetical protein
MTRRINPKKRKLNVEWSTERWVPEIQVRPASRPNGIQALYDPFSFVPGKPRKRKQQASVLWVRPGTRSSWR